MVIDNPVKYPGLNNKRPSYEEIHHLAQTNYKYVRMSGRSEENAKIKLVVPIFQAFGYDVTEDMDFEVTTPNLSAVDIVLLKNCERVAIIETKELDRNLAFDAEQALGYGLQLNIEWVFLSNGDETRVFNLRTWDSLLVSFKLRELEKRYDELSNLLHRDHMPEAPALRNLMKGKPFRDPSSRTSDSDRLFRDLKELLLGITNKDGEHVFYEKPPTSRGVYWACAIKSKKDSFLSLRPAKGSLEVYLYRHAYRGITDLQNITEFIRALPGIFSVVVNEKEGFIKFNIVDDQGIRAFVEICKNRLLLM